MKKYFLIALVFSIIFLAMLSVAILDFHKSSFNKVISSSFAGVIVEINDNGLIIQTRGGKKLPVLFLPNTKILKGNMFSSRNELIIGEYAIVIGSIESSGVIDAKTLRVLKK